MDGIKLLDVISKLEDTESGNDFGTISVTDVPGFDKLFSACDTAGVPFTADGLRKLARRLAARRSEPVERFLSMAPGAVADYVGRFNLKPERIPA